MKTKSKVIAIDGPSGSGKSTIAKILADNLSLTYLDTGAMFRAIAWHLQSKDINFENIEQGSTEIERELASLKFEYASSHSSLVSINGKDLTFLIREHIVSLWASQVSQILCVREFLKNLQRDIACQRPSILEGRDIGTIIFPDAALKFFLTADSEVRARRRLVELEAKDAATEYSFKKILSDIRERDQKDTEREIAPLVKASDAVELDTTSMKIEEVVSLITQAYLKNKSLF